MKGAHYRVRNMSRLQRALFGSAVCLCLFGLGIGIVSANTGVGRVSAITTTTFVSTTTTTEVTTTTAADITRPKPTVLHQRAEIGTALSAAFHGVHGGASVLHLPCEVRAAASQPTGAHPASTRRIPMPACGRRAESRLQLTGSSDCK